MPILIKTVVRLPSLERIKKGKFYYGFVCTECKSRIYTLDDNSEGAHESPIAGGDGQFCTGCPTCRQDVILYPPSELVLFQAPEDQVFSPAYPRRTASGKSRQKLSNRYPKAGAIFGTKFLEDRPECAVIFARCIATWSYVEQQTALLLAVILKINTAPALAMFLAMQSTRIQIPVLTAAAKTVLEEKDFELFQSIMNIRSTIEKSRNDLAHGLIGGSLNVDNGIIWAEQSDLVRHTAAVWSSDYTQIAFVQ